MSLRKEEGSIRHAVARPLHDLGAKHFSYTPEEQSSCIGAQPHLTKCYVSPKVENDATWGGAGEMREQEHCTLRVVTLASWV